MISPRNKKLLKHGWVIVTRSLLFIPYIAIAAWFLGNTLFSVSWNSDWFDIYADWWNSFTSLF